MPATEKPTQDDQFWRSHVAQWRDSGLTQAAYSRQYDLCPHSLSYYKRKYATGLEPVKRKQSGFASVQVIPAPQHYEPLTLHFTNGVRLSGIAEHNVAVVKQLSEVLS